MQQSLNYSIFSHENGLPSILIYFVLKSKKALFYGLCKGKVRYFLMNIIRYWSRLLTNISRAQCFICMKIYPQFLSISGYVQKLFKYRVCVTLAFIFIFLHHLRSIVFDILKKIIFIQYIFSSDCHIVVY